MCVYCMIGDWHFRRDPPWHPREEPVWPPTVPLPPLTPLTPNLLPLPPAPVIQPWSLDKLREFEDLLKRVKELEDRLGCPCEPNKADYLGLLRQRIEKLEAIEREREKPEGAKRGAKRSGSTAKPRSRDGEAGAPE